jgi:hypothetical protein
VFKRVHQNLLEILRYSRGMGPNPKPVKERRDMFIDLKKPETAESF